MQRHTRRETHERGKLDDHSQRPDHEFQYYELHKWRQSADAQNRTLELHVSGTNEGTITSTGAEITLEAFGCHCIFGTNATDLGKFTGSAKTGGAATLDAVATIPRTAGR